MPMLAFEVWTNTNWVSLSFLLKVLILSHIAISEDPQISVINKDVVILGGGASGTYATVRLREDFNKSVVLIEKESKLVGQ
jgi:heterodisulfide reductase subunit A-like polyferredoxin